MELIDELIDQKRSLITLGVYDIRLSWPDTLETLQDQRIEYELELVLISHVQRVLDVVDDIVVVAKPRLAGPSFQEIRHANPVFAHQDAVVDVFALLHQLQGRNEGLI